MKNPFFAAIIVCFCLTGLLCASARSNLSGGNRAYNREKYDTALEKYTLAGNAAPDSFEPAFNKGDVHYKTGLYQDALKSFEKATYSKDVELQGKAYYNMGNASFRLGKLSEAVQFYKKALELNFLDKDAKFNYEFAQKKIKENADKNKEQKKQEQKQDKNEKQNDKDKKNTDNKSDKDKDKENKGKKDENKQENKENKKEGMSKEDAQRLLDALSDEKKPKQKANVKIPLFRMPEKDW